MNHLTRALAALILWCGCALAASSVLVSDTLRVGPENGLFSGTITVTSPQMYRAGVRYERWVRVYRIDSGVVAITLVPNVGSTPDATRYRIEYAPDSNARPWTREWSIPDSSSPVTITTVEVADTSVPAAIPLLNLSQINPVGATNDFCIKWTNGAVAWGACTVSAVTSVFARTGAVIAQSGDYAAFYAALAHVHAVADVTGLQAALDGKAATSHAHTTSGVSEGSNLYYTDARVRAAITATSPLVMTNGVLSCPTCGTGLVTAAGTGLILAGTTMSIDSDVPRFSSGAGAPSGPCNGVRLHLRDDNTLYTCLADVWTLGGSTYTLPTATASVLGGIKIGSGLSIDGSGVVTASGNVSVTTKGDVQTYSTAAARLPVGTNGQYLSADSVEATGLKWVTAPSVSVTTKGDVQTYSTTAARLPVGTNGQILSADSTEATGLKWVAAASGSVGTAFHNQHGYFNVASKNTQYTGPVTYGSIGTSTESNIQKLIRVAGTIGDVTANVIAASGANCEAVISVRKNGAASSATLIVAAGETGQRYGTSTDTVVAGDLLSVGILVRDVGGTCAGSTGFTVYSVGFRYY